LAYSWFDPETESYQTTRSDPIALNVSPANVISASDVVSNAPSRQKNSANDVSGNNSTEVAAAPTSGSAFTLSGADLAIQPNAGVVLRNSGGRFGSVTTQAAIYAVGLLLIAVALLDRKRKEVDPTITAQRKNLRQQRAHIAAAAAQPRQQAAEEIAAAIRALVAELPNVARDEAQAVIAECESVVYAREGTGNNRLDDALINRAKTVAERFIKEAE